MVSIPQGAWPRHTNGARLPPGTRVYAVGDIHGRPDLLAAINDRIAEDAERTRAERTVLVYLGDYIDRGEDSRQVIELLCAPADPDLERIFLKGNHEAMMLSFLDRSMSCGIWVMNGGVATLRSYGVRFGDFGDLPRDTAAENALRDRLRSNLPEAHLRFLGGLRLWHAEGDYLFVHAGVRPGVPLQAQDPHDLLWIRHEFLGSRLPFPGVVVHGHTIQHAPEIEKHRIGIDTGAYLSGALTCAVIEEAGIRFLQTRDV